MTAEEDWNLEAHSGLSTQLLDMRTMLALSMDGDALPFPLAALTVRGVIVRRLHLSHRLVQEKRRALAFVLFDWIRRPCRICCRPAGCRRRHLLYVQHPPRAGVPHSIPKYFRDNQLQPQPYRNRQRRDAVLK